MGRLVIESQVRFGFFGPLDKTGTRTGFVFLKQQKPWTELIRTGQNQSFYQSRPTVTGSSFSAVLTGCDRLQPVRVGHLPIYYSFLDFKWHYVDFNLCSQFLFQRKCYASHDLQDMIKTRAYYMIDRAKRERAKNNYKEAILSSKSLSNANNSSKSSNATSSTTSEFMAAQLHDLDRQAYFMSCTFSKRSTPRRERWSVAISLPWENSRSHETDDAGMGRTSRAMRARVG